jgi:hypothetical protein
MEKRKVPELLIEKIVLGELPEAQKRRLMADPDVVRRVRELERSNREILSMYPPDEMSRRISGRLEALASAQGPVATVERARSRDERRRSRRRDDARGSEARSVFGLPPLIPVAGFATVAVVTGLLLAVLLPGGLRSGQATASVVEETRVKGLKPHLVVYHKTESGAETLRENDAVAEHDVLQLGYVSGSKSYGVIVSIDGRGVVTLHFPTASATAGELELEGESLLPFAYELDDAPSFERFFLVTSPEPFPVNVVVGAAERLSGAPEKARRAALELPRKLEQTSIVLLKKAAGR